MNIKISKGVVKGKLRPLIIISEPNSKGEYFAIAGSTKIHQWVDEEHILIPPDMVLGGNLTSRPFFLQVSRFCFWVGVYPGMTEEMIGFMIEKIRKVAERFEVRGLGGEVRG